MMDNYNHNIFTITNYHELPCNLTMATYGNHGTCVVKYTGVFVYTYFSWIVDGFKPDVPK